MNESLSSPSNNVREDYSDDYHHATSVDSLTQRNVETIVRLDAAAQASRKKSDCAVDAVADFCGRLSFVWWHFAIFIFWIGWNALAPHAWRFDPYPFEFLTFSVSLEAIFLSTFILISQNRQARISERRSQLDLQINLLTEQENAKILHLLDKIAQKLEIHERDPEVQVLEAGARPEKLLEQIEISRQLSQRSRSTSTRSKNQISKNQDSTP